MLPSTIVLMAATLGAACCRALRHVVEGCSTNSYRTVEDEPTGSRTYFGAWPAPVRSSTSRRSPTRSPPTACTASAPARWRARSASPSQPSTSTARARTRSSCAASRPRSSASPTGCTRPSARAPGAARATVQPRRHRRCSTTPPPGRRAHACWPTPPTTAPPRWPPTSRRRCGGSPIASRRASRAISPPTGWIRRSRRFSRAPCTARRWRWREARPGERRPARSRLAALAAGMVPLPPTLPAEAWPTA